MLTLKYPKLFKQQCYINGQWLDAENKEKISVSNPASGEVLGTVPRMGADEVRYAIECANKAWGAWRNKTSVERAAVLRRWLDLVLENINDLAAILTAEQGKPLAESRSEIAYAASYLEWYAEEGKRAYGEMIPAPSPDKRLLVAKEPIGVCAAITPWNFPSAMITRKVGAALGAGCTIVVKPALQTPFSALALAALAEDAGVPAGVFSIVTGSASAIGWEMTTNPLVRKVTFTGSTEIGRLIMQQSASTIKKVSVELGGNAPFIVFDDADLDAAVDGAMISKFRNSGQTCVCTNRFYIHENIYDAFNERLTNAVLKLQVGNGIDQNVDQGPLIDKAAVNKLEEHIADALEKGGKLLAGGNRHALGRSFFEPTIIADATANMLVSKEETFGPLAAVYRFSTEEEVIKLANDTEFGLAAYFYSRDIGRVWRVSAALEYGMVGVNTGAISNSAAPFGGIKQSGLGREGSRHGLDDYLTVKYLCIGGI